MAKHSPRADLWLFREQIYQSLGRRRDALFDLLDALLAVGLVPSFVHLSLSALFQRGWGSAYDALASGEIDEGWLREIVASHPFDEGAPLYAIDTSVWARCDAECSPARGSYHHPSRHSAGQPIVAGWSSSWLAQLSLSKDSWTAPLDVRRVPPDENAHDTAVAQIRDLLAGPFAPTTAPTCVFDGGYDPVRLARELGELDGERVAVLVRLRRDRCFYADPPEANGPKIGRPNRHGTKFACRDETTWPTPTDAYEVDDPQ
jgi:hypothetical protein